MLIDSAIIVVRSGKGGDGAVAFRREKYVPKGGPDGGDGGDGGDVILVADPDVATLLDFAGRHHWRAENGQPGSGKGMDGRDGADLEVLLPAGTLVYELDPDHPDDAEGTLLVDLDRVGMRHAIAEGGRGGKGNRRFATATHQTPREAEPGGAAVERRLRLELKLIADVGLVGLPNAGKSTLLGRVSRATPKIADYPFTTLEPQLGIAELPGGGGHGLARRLVIADIPGLIERASQGAGLGTRFLRHIERTAVLVHVLDPMPPDGADPVRAYRAIRGELAAHSPTLAAKPEVVAVNKADLFGGGDSEAAKAAAAAIAEAVGREVFIISAATGEGVRPLLEACWAARGEQVDLDAEQPGGGWRV